MRTQLKKEFNRLHRLVKSQVFEYESKTVENKLLSIPQVTDNSHLFYKKVKSFTKKTTL